MPIFTPEWHDDIEQGATFYRVVTLYTDRAKTQRVDLTGKQPRASLMFYPSGAHAADFGCSILGDPVNGQVVWVLSRGITADLDSSKLYIHNLDLDSTSEPMTERVLHGRISVHRGQVLTP